MSDQPVTPDREALKVAIRAVSFKAHQPERVYVDDCIGEEGIDALAAGLLPLLTDARQQGWRDHWEYVIRGGGSDLGKPDDLDRLRARLAPWDQCLAVDPFTGQPDHEHGDSCEGCE